MTKIIPKFFLILFNNISYVLKAFNNNEKNFIKNNLSKNEAKIQKHLQDISLDNNKNFTLHHDYKNFD